MTIFMLTRITPSGQIRSQGPVARRSTAEVLAARVLTDNTATTKQAAQSFSVELSKAPDGEVVLHEPTGYQFRIDRADVPETTP